MQDALVPRKLTPHSIVTELLKFIKSLEQNEQTIPLVIMINTLYKWIEENRVVLNEKDTLLKLLKHLIDKAPQNPSPFFLLP